VRGGGTYSIRNIRKKLTLTTGDVKQNDQLETRVLYTPDIRMSPLDVTGKHKVENCGEKRTEWNYNANGGNVVFSCL
jgi:hypothetical protein